MTFEITGPIWFWKGPAPWYFVTVPQDVSLEIKAVERLVTYGWGMIPVRVRIGRTEWETALWPKDGLYVIPIRAHVRRAEGLEEGAEAHVRLDVRGAA